MDKLWFAAWEEIYSDKKEDIYFDSTLINEIQGVENNIVDIRREFINNKNINLFSFYFQDELQIPKKTWSTIPVLTFGLKKDILKHFPILKREIENEELIVGAFYSKACPYSKIEPHSGITNAIYRCHIAIQLSEIENDLGIEVSGVPKKWSLDKFVAFNDCNYHKSWNNTSEDRVVLIIDVLKKEYIHKKYFIFSRIYFSYFLLKVNEKFKWKKLYKFLCNLKSKWVISYCSILLIPIVFFMIKLNNRLK